VTEADFWKRLQRHLGRNAQRIENRVGVGIPDILLTYPTNQIVFLELKVGHYLWNRSLGFKVTLHDIRPAQKIWHRNFADIGGKSFILAECLALEERKRKLFLFKSYPHRNWPGDMEGMLFDQYRELFPDSWVFEDDLSICFPDLLSKMISPL